ncbi:MAG: glycosyltransferase [Bryobacterales bacterium]|nr:glycosyltransferase [Bryobacterales bacterium]
MNNQKVSVIMPVLNGEKYIGEAVASIAAQTYRPIELVLVDDGSSDGTQAAARAAAAGLEVRVVRHETPQGIPRSMNDGVRHATGGFIAFLDHDDSWFPEFAATQMAYLHAHPETGMVHSDFQTIDSAGAVLEESVSVSRRRGARPTGQVFAQLFMDSFIVGNSVMIRRECFEKVGMFDESLRWGDYHLWMRIARQYRVDYVPQVLTRYRQHPTQSTRTPANARPFQDSVPLQALNKILTECPGVREELGVRAVNERRAGLLFELAYTWWSKRESGHARACLREAMKLTPGNARLYAFYAATLLGPSIGFGLRDAVRWMRETAFGVKVNGLTTGRAS